MNEELRLFGINKKFVSDWLNRIMNEEDIPLFDNLPLGTHSIKKFLSVYTRHKACSRNGAEV